MARLEELFDVKEEAMSKLIMDDALINALTLKDVDSPVTERVELLYRNIFPYKRAVDETLTDKTCFIAMETSAFGQVQSKFKEFSLVFYIIVHEELIMMNLGKRRVTRTDYLAHRIDSVFNQTRGFGIGRLSFGGVRNVKLPSNWLGMGIYYETLDFN